MSALVRKSCERDYKQHFGAYILARLGELRLEQVQTDTLEGFRTYLLEDRGLSIKTVRNIIDGSFRAFWRHARKTAKVVTHDPFTDLDWPEGDDLEPDPFTEQERDAIIEYFRIRCAHYYLWVFFQFWTGMRPSESAGLRMGNVDLKSGRVSIVKSRTMGELNRTKTKQSKRTITLLPNVLELLNKVIRLRAEESDHLFVNTEGRPIVPDNFRKEYWYAALTGAGIRRPRKAYCMRHTFISVMLSSAENIKQIAEYCGTSVAMIEKHYGKFIADDTNFGARAIGKSLKNRDLNRDPQAIKRKKLRRFN